MAAPWTAEERAWALECFKAGDSLAEIADMAERDLMDVARALNLHRYRPPSLRWRQSHRTGGYKRSPWIGGLLKEVAIARYLAGEDIDALLADAKISRSKFYYMLDVAGVGRRAPRRGHRAYRQGEDRREAA